MSELRSGKIFRNLRETSEIFFGLDNLTSHSPSRPVSRLSLTSPIKPSTANSTTDLTPSQPPFSNMMFQPHQTFNIVQKFDGSSIPVEDFLENVESMIIQGGMSRDDPSLAINA